MSETLLPAIELNPAGKIRGVVIWLHGLGADGNDFVPIVRELGLPADAGIRFVFPHAPKMPVTVNAGYVMPAWYDIAQPDLGRQQDEAGIRASERAIRALIERESMRVPSERIVLAGFSQGGAVALHTALRYPQPLAGILALSTYLPLAETLAAEAHPANAQVPIMMAHGLQDPIVAPALAEASRQRLVQLGYQVAWHTYAMPHSVCPEEIEDIGRWLAGISHRTTNAC